jgi:hypothetical protein
MAETNIKVLKIEVDTGTGAIKVNGVTKSIKEATAATKEFVTSAGKMEDATVGFNNAAGLAGATVNEFGRLISDMPFGLTAVTNNISQLGSLFSVLVGKASQINNGLGTLKNTIALLKKELMGPLGILLLFQGAVAALEVWAQNAKKADKTTSDLNKSVGEAATELKIARDILNDSTASLEQKQSILSQVNKEYKDFNLVLDKNGIATAASTAALDKQISALERLAKSQAIVNQVQILYGEIAILMVKTGTEVATFWDQLAARSKATSLFTALFGFGGNTKQAIEEEGNKTKDQLVAKTQETIDALLKQLEVLFNDKKPNGAAKSSLDDFNLMLIRSQIGYLESIDTNSEEYQIKLLNQITDLKIQELKILEEAAVKKAIAEGRSSDELLILSTTYENKRQAILLGSNSKLMEIMKSFNKELKAEVMKMSDVTSDEQKDLNILNKIFGTDVKTAENQLKDYSNKLIKGLADYQKRREDTEKRGNEAVAKLKEENTLAAIYAAQDLSNAVFGVMDASFQREMDIEQDKTNKINNELKERLANENLSANGRKEIQAEIAANDEALRKKQEEIEKKKFKLNKVASIANATINTYLAASAALKDPALSTFQRIASMVAIIGSGLAQVAMIAKQKFVSSQSGLSGAGGRGGAGGAGGIQAPDFNIVGQSASNQIAAAVQGQFSQPIKAYVVSKDITTAQAMDRNIIGTASLG